MKKRLLAAAMTAFIAGPAMADPPVASVDLPQVFCFRITDIERPVDAYTGNDPVNGTLINDDSFLFEFEVLNWTNSSAFGLQLSLNTGTSAGVTVGDAFIDADGRGGTNDLTPGVAGAPDNPNYGQIGTGVSDPIPHQSGRGNSLFANDWQVQEQTTSQVIFDAQVSFDGIPTAPGDLCEVDCDTLGGVSIGGTALPGEDLIFGRGRVPGTGLDALGDTAIDGGPGPYTTGPDDGNPLVDGVVQAPGTGNVLDGFVIRVDGLGIGDAISFNWFLLGVDFFAGGGGEFASFAIGDGDGGVDCNLNPSDCFFPLGTAFGGNQFGFGTFSLARTAIGGPLPGPLFEGNSGFNQNPITFFDDVWNLPNPASMAGENGAGITAPFQNPANNVFGAPTNTSLTVPEPASLSLLGLGLLGIYGLRRRRLS